MSVIGVTRRGLAAAAVLFLAVVLLAAGAKAATFAPAPGALNAAFRAAQPGDVVHLVPGDYTGSFYGPAYDKAAPGVTVEAEPGANLRGLAFQLVGGYHFKGGAFAATAAGQALSLLKAHDVTIDGCAIADQRGAAPDAVRKLGSVGVRIVDSHDIAVTRCDIGWLGFGISHTGSTGLAFTDNTIHDISNDGIRGNSSHVLIARNLFTDFYAATAADGTKVHNDPIQFWTSNTTGPIVGVAVFDNQELRGAGDPASELQLGDESDRSQGSSWQAIRYGYLHPVVAGNLFAMGGNFGIEGAVDAEVRSNIFISAADDTHVLPDGSTAGLAPRVVLSHSIRGTIADNIGPMPSQWANPIEKPTVSGETVDPGLKVQTTADREMVARVWTAGLLAGRQAP